MALNTNNKNHLRNQFNLLKSVMLTINVSGLNKGNYLIGFGKKQTTKFVVL